MKEVQQFRLDWVRLLIPYSYTLVCDETRDSAHHHKLDVGKVNEGFSSIVKSLFSILAIDGPNKTDLEFFEFYQGGKPYDARYSRDGFDLRFNQLEASAKAPVTRIQMGLKLDIQGRGCRYIERALSRDGHSWRWLFMALRSKFPDIKYRRIDIARDYYRYTRHLTPWSILSRFNKERRYVEETGKHGKFVITRRHSFRGYNAGDAVDGVVKGDTFYLGSPSDSLMLRIYDKEAERIFSHGDTWRLRGKNKKYWYRWEIQISGDVADKVGNLLADGKSGSSIWLSCINRMFAIAPTPLEQKRGHKVKVKTRIYDPQNGKYIDKDIEVADWWADWINQSAVDQYHLTTIVRYSDIESSDNWLEGPVAHSLAVRLVTHVLRGGDGEKLVQHWLKQGNKQLNFSDINRVKSQLSMLNDVAVRELTLGSAQVDAITRRQKAEKRIAVDKLKASGEERELTLADYVEKRS